MSFADHFSAQAGAYARFRPTYPPSLFAALADLAPGRARALDVGTGNGQAAVALADRFDEVVAVDPSAEQIARATPHPRVRYAVAPAERTGVDDRSVDLVCAAQAAHWFDADAFAAEVRRVLRPGGIVAVWAYGFHRAGEPGLDEALAGFDRGVLGPYWPPQNRLVWEGYRDLPFPFAEVPVPAFVSVLRVDLPALLGYFASWSATRRFADATGLDPLVEAEARLRDAWGDPSTVRELVAPLALRVGR